MKIKTKRQLLSTTALSVIAGLLLLGGLFFLRSHVIRARADVLAPAQSPWALHVIKVGKGTITQGFPVLATLSSQDEISLKPQLSGTISFIGPRAGKKVRKGEVLVRIDTSEISNNLAALEASLVSAKANVALQAAELKRTRKLKSKGYATPEQYDKLVAALKGAQGQVGQLEAQIAATKTRIAYGIIHSPVNGSVITRNQTKGDLASPGKEIYRINVASGAKVMVSVPQEVLAGIKPGSAVVLTYGALSKTVRLTRLGPSLDALSMGTAEADIDVIPFHLPSGARVPARVVTRSNEGVLIVPLSALVLSADGQNGHVFKVERTGKNRRAVLHKINVRLVARGSEGVGVSGDLSPGDELVSAHQTVLLRLREGEAVRPYPLSLQVQNSGRGE